LLLALALGSGCGARGLDAKDAEPTSGDGGSADAGRDGDVPAATDSDDWIYVATTNGVDRVNVGGGAFAPFGLSVDTLSVFPSPTGRLIAQELADQRVAVFAADGASHATFDVRMGLLGWSDEETLLFLDPETKFLQQTSVDGTIRRYLPLPSGLNAYGYTGAAMSPDRSLVLVRADPFARDNVLGSYLMVLSAVDGSLVRDLGVHRDGGAWTGDGRLIVRASVEGDFVALSPRLGTSTPVVGADAWDRSCGFVSWYETAKILLGKEVSSGDTGRCVPSATLDVDTGASTAFTGTYVGSTQTSGLVVPPFAHAADGRQAAVASAWDLELGAVAGGERRRVGSARGSIVGVSWAHPTGGTAHLVAPPTPPATVAARAGAPAIAERSGGTDCLTGRWVNRTPETLPAGWPGPWGGSFAFDTDRGTLLVEGSYATAAELFLGTLPNLAYETLEWDGAEGLWTNLSRRDGFGPARGRAMAYDGHRKVVLAAGNDLPGDGPWTWTRTTGWQNLRVSTLGSIRPYGLSDAYSVYDTNRDRWVLLGGYDAATWEWNGASWMRSTAAPPGGTTPLSAGRLVYDDRRGRIYFVGGRDRGSSPWLYEPAQSRWTAQSSTGPSPLPRDWAGVAYDARRDRVMVFGGYVLGSGTADDLAEWDPATGAWQTCPPTGVSPGPRQNVALVYDAGRDALLLLGGPATDAAPELWEWYVP
jgi:hypothetical protein